MASVTGLKGGQACEEEGQSSAVSVQFVQSSESARAGVRDACGTLVIKYCIAGSRRSPVIAHHENHQKKDSCIGGEEPVIRTSYTDTHTHTRACARTHTGMQAARPHVMIDIGVNSIHAHDEEISPGGGGQVGGLPSSCTNTRANMLRRLSVDMLSLQGESASVNACETSFEPTSTAELPEATDANTAAALGFVIERRAAWSLCAFSF